MWLFLGVLILESLKKFPRFFVVVFYFLFVRAKALECHCFEYFEYSCAFCCDYSCGDKCTAMKSHVCWRENRSSGQVHGWQQCKGFSALGLYNGFLPASKYQRQYLKCLGNMSTSWWPVRHLWADSSDTERHYRRAFFPREKKQKKRVLSHYQGSHRLLECFKLDFEHGKFYGCE